MQPPRPKAPRRGIALPLRPAFALAVALLAACKVAPPLPPGPAEPTRSPRPAGSQAPDPAKPSGMPGPGAVTAPAAPAGLLRAPAGEAVRLRGQVRLDPVYAVAAGGVVANHGGRLVVAGAPTPGAGNAVGGDASLFALHGTALTGKVKLLAADGVGIVANNGARVISNNGGGIVSNNGGSLITDNGGGILSDQGLGAARGYRLRQAEGAAAPLPAVGMLVGVYSLERGGMLPLGVDAAGAPVYTAYTDADGGFDVHLPAGVRENVLVVASVPGTRDPRLAVDLIASPRQAAPVAVDDGSSALTSYLVRSFAGRMEEAVAPDPCRAAPPAEVAEVADAVASVLRAFILDFQDGDLKRLPHAAKLRVAGRFTDAALSGLDMPSLTLGADPVLGAAAGRPADEALRTEFLRVRAAAAARLAAAPAFFDGRPYVVGTNAGRAGAPYTIRKASDLCELLVTEVAATNGRRGAVLETALVDLGIAPRPTVAVLQAGGNAVTLALAAELQDAVAGARLREVAKAAIAEELAALGGAAGVDPPCPPAPTPPAFAAEVGTLAGAGAPGRADGPGASATFDQPLGLAYDPRGWLVVSQAGGYLRRIDLNDPARAVTTVAGNGPGFADGAGGPGGPARFTNLGSMAIDQAGRLIVADRGNHRIRVVTGWDGAEPVVSTLAGDGTAGSVDGPGAAARFDTPTDVAVAPDGAIWVAEFRGHRVRRIGPDGVVSTLAGGGASKDAEGFGAEAGLRAPFGVAFLPDGQAVVSDAGNARLRLVGPDGAVGTLAGASGAEVLDGPLFAARFLNPTALALGPRGVVVAEPNVHALRLVTPGGWVTTLLANPTAEGGFADGAAGPAGPARLDGPADVAIGADGMIYVADRQNHRIRTVRLTPRP